MPTQKNKRRRRRPRRRGRKGHYITGIHHSQKCSEPIRYRSSWELTVCIHLDNDPSVVNYAYEAVEISYVSNKQTGKKRKYLPDFLISYKDKSKKLVEVKRKSQLNNRTVMKKANAAREWCAQQGNVKYEFWSEAHIQAFAKIQKALKAPCK